MNRLPVVRIGVVDVVTFVVVVAAICVEVSFGKELVDRTKQIPDVNICVYSREVLKEVFDCLFESINKQISDYFLNMIKQLFPDLDYVDAVKFICKSNNDDGHMLIQMVKDTHGEDVIRDNLKSIWACYDRYQHLLV